MIEERNDMQMDFDEDAQYTERKRILFSVCHGPLPNITSNQV